MENNTALELLVAGAIIHFVSILLCIFIGRLLNKKGVSYEDGMPLGACFIPIINIVMLTICVISYSFSPNNKLVKWYYDRE
jgi:uncharacterized BrkB/YihY/UPF0761 family membrane protein